MPVELIFAAKCTGNAEAAVTFTTLMLRQSFARSDREGETTQGAHASAGRSGGGSNDGMPTMM